MKKDFTKKDADPRVVYADIIDLPHWQSPVRPHMSLYDRAAQFAPFAALTGYDDMIREEARHVGRRIEPGEEELEILNRKLSMIRESLRTGFHPRLAVTRFLPDPEKEGGEYKTVEGRAKKLDALHGRLFLEETDPASGSIVEIAFRDILEIHDAADAEKSTKFSMDDT